MSGWDDRDIEPFVSIEQYEALKADHARIVAEQKAVYDEFMRDGGTLLVKYLEDIAELDEKNDDLVVLVSKLEQREQELRTLLAKYQRLHAADVAWDECLEHAVVPLEAVDQRKAAMDALA